MTSITSLYIPKVEKKITGEFIANVFERNHIAKVSRVLIEPYVSKSKSNHYKYNSAYIEINFWYDSEIAFNFIKRLNSNNREARIVYQYDNWWSVKKNEFPLKISRSYPGVRIITIFNDSSTNHYNDVDNIDDDLSTKTLYSNHFDIDYEKSKQLKAIIYGYKNTDEMDDVEIFNGYLNEIYNDRS